MRRTVALTFVIALGLIVGCSSKGSNVAKGDNSVLDPAPADRNIPPAEPAVAAAPINDSPAVAFAPAPAPVTPAAMTTPAAPAAKTYTVKKGDTLYSIAKSQLGGGKNWQKIVAANPGLSPATLKAGQQIAMP